MDLGLTTTRNSMYSDSDLLGSFDPFFMRHNPTLQKQHVEAAHRRRQSVAMALQRFLFAILGGLAVIIPAIVVVAGKAPVKTLSVVPCSI